MSCQLDEKPPAMLTAVTASSAAAARQGTAEGCNNGSTPVAAAGSSVSSMTVKDEPRAQPPTFAKDMSNYRDSTKKSSSSSVIPIGVDQSLYDRQLLAPLLAAGGATPSAFTGSSRSTARHAAAAAAAAAVAAAASLRGSNDDDEDDGPGGCGSNSDRLRNDLLDEICNDMGIHDSMDLDFYDFPAGGSAASPAPYDDRLLPAAAAAAGGSSGSNGRAAGSRTVAAATAVPPAAQAVQVKHEGSDSGAGAAGAAAASSGCARTMLSELGGSSNGRGFGVDDLHAMPSAGMTTAANSSTASISAASGGASSAVVVGSEQRQPMDCAERGGAATAATPAMMMQYGAAFQQQQAAEEGRGSGKEPPSPSNGANSSVHHHCRNGSSSSGGGSSSSASPDLLSGLRQGLAGATDDSKFSMAQQHSSKAAPQRQQSRSDYSPYQVPSKQQQLQSAAAAAGYYQGQGELTPSGGCFGMRRSGSAMMVDGGGQLADSSWFDGSSSSGSNTGAAGNSGARWTSFPTAAAAAAVVASAAATAGAVNGHHCEDGGAPATAHDYPEDFCMEDLTAPDSTINFSELPQQPNYYQVPEFSGLTAQNGQLNISFNMSLSSGGQPAIAATQQVGVHPPPLYHLPSGAATAAAAQAGARQQASIAAAAAAAQGLPYLKRQVSAPVMHSTGVPFSGSNSVAGQSSGHHHHPQMASQLMSCSGGNSMYGSSLATGHSAQAQSQHGRFPATAGSAPALPTATSAMGYRASAAYQGAGGNSSTGLLAQATSASSSVNPASSAGFCSSAAAMAAVTMAGSDQQQQALMNAAMSTASSVQASPVHQQLPSAPAAPNTHDFMQRLVMDKSSAFRSHPLFPLLRDLIIADMNFHEPSFPHQLIRDLPADFGKLLKNYLTRNPPRGTYQTNHSVESVVTDALRFAHHSLIDKIQQKRAAAAAADVSSLRAVAEGGSAAGGTSLQQQMSAECGRVGPQSEMDGSLRQGLEQAPGDGSLSADAGHVVGQASADGIMAGMSAHMASPNYRQPLTVDTSCGLGAQSPMTMGSQSSCYTGTAASGRLMAPNGASMPRQFTTSQRPTMQQPATSYAQQQAHAAASASTASGYQQAFGSLMGANSAGASDGSAGARDTSCYYYGGPGGPGSIASSSDGFAQSSYQSPEHMTPLGSGASTMMHQPLPHRQHQQAAMSGLQYGGGSSSGTASGLAGMSSPLYSQQGYSHMQNGAQMMERQHDMGQMYGGGGDASYLMKPILEPGRMPRGYVGGPSAAAGSAASAHCIDYVRTAGSMGRVGGASSGSMSDMLGGMPSSSCLGAGGHHHLAGGHMQPGKLGHLQQQQQQPGMGAGVAGGNGAAEGATRKHQSLPKEAVSVMLSWLKEHQDKPYPNDDEKSALIKQTGLSITQINYWFTNARRRLLPKWRGEDM